MKEETRQIAEAVITNGKASWLVVFGVYFNTWWADWGNLLVDVASSVAGFLLAIILIRLNHQKYKIAKRENEEAESNKDGQ